MGETIGVFKSWGPSLMMKELENLAELGLIRPTEYTAVAFVDMQSIPVTFHFAITAEGKGAAAKPPTTGFVVGEP